jgi:hypothetical protein
MAKRVADPKAMPVFWKKVGAIYRSFAQERFSRLSRGGGEWPPLAESTIARRRKRSSSILYDKGLLFAALAPSLNAGGGAYEQVTSTGVRLGYGGPMKYEGEGKVTLADIASFHQTGSDRLPQRKIIVEPDQATMNIMIRELDKWLIQ